MILDRVRILKSQLLYQLSYAPKSLMPQGDLQGFAHPDLGRNGNGTYIYGKRGVPSISTSLARCDFAFVRPVSDRSANQGRRSLRAARAVIWVCCTAILFCAAILIAAQTETGRHALILLVTGGAKG
jgi:hypothetical protein